MKLVIVESPTKAKTIAKFLGRGFLVKSSFGHVRDLPKGQMGVDPANNFTPRYVIPTSARKTVTSLRKNAAQAQTIIFATDEDREGEAISWHLKEIFAKELGAEFTQKKIERIAFHEITKEAIAQALGSPREIDLHLVDAQQARRILDRLVGYELSPLLWAKVAKGLSAGRVQSVALRFIVEREREILAFQVEEYWTIEGTFTKETKEEFAAKLIKINGTQLEKFSLKTEVEAKKIVEALKGATFTVTGVAKKTTHRSPAPPFITSTMQQEANRKLGFSAKQTMLIAQQLYEGVALGEEGQAGLITYMRTDSVNLSEQFIAEARTEIKQRFGERALPSQPRFYRTKSRLAQEAHEAIRPTSPAYHPDSIKKYLESNQFKLYDLIWRRALACQMLDAEFETTSADILGAEKYVFRAAGSRLVVDGFLAVWPEIERTGDLPALDENEKVLAKEIRPEQHFTEPPSRYSDASLVKIMEENGIGRPSTYAPTIATLLERNYVERIEGRRLKPTDIALVVTDLLVAHFPMIVDYQFTAKLEEELDDIANGTKEWPPVIREFYDPFKANLDQKQALLIKSELTEKPSEEKCDLCGQPMIVKISRFGKFLACTGFPACRGRKSISSSGEILPEEKTEEKCETCGAAMQVKHGRFGAFLSCSRYPECKTMKPLLKLIGQKCPKCLEGEVAERRSKRGRRFWGCNRWPACDYLSWQNPQTEKKVEN